MIIWTLKAILRSFELVSGLKVNFHKSCLFGINVGGDFLLASSNFLSCNHGQLPFSYLGLPTGANPKKFSTCQPVDVMRKRLSTWKGSYLSLGGRIVRIQSVLSSLPLYFFSFYRVPRKVLKTLIGIQRSFLWGGYESRRNIAWISWKKVCSPREQGGLGLKDLDLFNMSLLGRRWRILVDKHACWWHIIQDRYGEVGSEVDLGKWSSRNSSQWWRNLCAIDQGGTMPLNWFSRELRRKVGNGESVSF